MEYKGKKLEDIVVTLPFADGTEMECGVVASFSLLDKDYFALLPMGADGKCDFSQSYMLYRVEEDAEGNPVVEYIEDDREYENAALFFSNRILHAGK